MSRILIGLEGTELTGAERAWLQRPDVAGAILFTRNWEGPEQVLALNRSIRSADVDALIAVDQEGGRVQRFGAPCTILPPLGRIGAIYDEDPDEALTLAFQHAWLMASEVLALGLDLSLAPVLDLEQGCPVVGDRAFHRRSAVVRELARAYVKGMHEAGMATTGKHFPGHGAVAEDTHDAVARDPRPLDDIAIEDLRPYSVAQRHGLDAIMMAHVIYPRVCEHPAGYSRIWCHDILRRRMRFGGVIISDDLGMRAAEDAGDFRQRYQASLIAGCDLVLVCRPDDVREAMEQITPGKSSSPDRRGALRRRREPVWAEFAGSEERQLAQQALNALNED